MKNKLYCLKDRLIGFQQPFIMQSDEVAVRAARSAVNANRFPDNLSDMELYRVGIFDDRTGDFESQLEFICNLLALKDGEDDEG